MGRHVAGRGDPGLSRRQDIARKFGLEPGSEPGQFEGRCPECSRDTFSIKHPDTSRYLLHIWTCPACQHTYGKPKEPGILRAAMLHHGILPGWLGGYGTSPKAGTDPATAALLEQTARDILDAPWLTLSQVRILLAEGLGQKVPTEYNAFVKWAMGLGIKRSKAYEAAATLCRPSDCHPSRGGGSADAKS